MKKRVDLRSRLRVFMPLFILGGAAIAGCSSGDVKKQENPNADFGQYMTYAWAPNDSHVSEGETDRHIKTAATHALASMGLIEVPATGAPALFLSYAVQPSELTFSFIEGVTKTVIWTGTVLHPKDLGDAANELVHAYKGSRDKEYSGAALAKFYLSIPPEFP